MRHEFICNAEGKKDCDYWELVPRSKRCKGCEVYNRGDFDNAVECSVDYCSNWLPRCKFDVDGSCESSVCKARVMVQEFEKIGLKCEITGIKEKKK